MTSDETRPEDSRERAVAVTEALLCAAAHADGADNLPPLLEAVEVHTGGLDRGEAVAVVGYLTVRIAALDKLVDQLTGSLERVTGAGTIERITRACERPDS